VKKHSPVLKQLLFTAEQVNRDAMSKSDYWHHVYGLSLLVPENLNKDRNKKALCQALFVQFFNTFSGADSL